MSRSAQCGILHGQSPGVVTPGDLFCRYGRWLGLLLCAGLLAACGGPSYKVKVIDKPGSGLKGTQRPYEVNGERFEPMLNADGYAEEGVASWYGPDFHGRKTSSGEIYNMNGFTAAHKTLPMHVSVRVTNKANGKQCVVRVNDRGPFVKGRVIDLSYGAAQQIGMVGTGTAAVRIETLGYREPGPRGAPPVYTQPDSYIAGPFTVQVGAFAMPQNAQRLAEELRATYGDASVVESWVNGQLFHRVRVGLYQTMAEAEKARLVFEEKGMQNSFVVAKD